MMIADGEVEAIGDPETVAALPVGQRKPRRKPAQASGGAWRLPERPERTLPITQDDCDLPQDAPSADTFKFDVEYQYDEPGDFYLAIALHDIPAAASR